MQLLSTFRSAEKRSREWQTSEKRQSEKLNDIFSISIKSVFTSEPFYPEPERQQRRSSPRMSLMEQTFQDSFDGVTQTLLPGFLLCTAGGSWYSQGSWRGYAVDPVGRSVLIIRSCEGSLSKRKTSAIVPHLEFYPHVLQPSYMFRMLSVHFVL